MPAPPARPAYALTHLRNISPDLALRFLETVPALQPELMAKNGKRQQPILRLPAFLIPATITGLLYPHRLPGNHL